VQKAGLLQVFDLAPRVLYPVLPAFKGLEKMFFVIAGIQPKTVELESQPRRCPSCGLHEARLKRVDHYLSLFFVPLFRVKKGTPLVQCRSCGSVGSETGQPGFEPPRRGQGVCPACGQTLDPGFKYCPSCGRPVR
jgi:hypothetical protein